jgi:hypothetical protein
LILEHVMTFFYHSLETASPHQVHDAGRTCGKCLSYNRAFNGHIIYCDKVDFTKLWKTRIPGAKKKIMRSCAIKELAVGDAAKPVVL